MKILVVVDSINIEDSSGSKANVALIQNLGLAGFEVLVYHYTQKNIQLAGVSCYAIPEIKFSPMYFLSRIQRVLARRLNWKLMPFLENEFGFSFTFFNDTSSIVSALEKLTFRPDLVLTLSKGASFRTHYAVLKLSQLHDKWMAYVHDPYPFHYYPRPYNWVEPGYEIKEKFFREVSEKAKYSAFPSQLLQEWMGSYYPDFLKTGVVIPHQNSQYEFQDINFPDFFNVSKFNLLHAGNLMKQRSPKGLLEGFTLFLSRNPAAKEESSLILLGQASYHKVLLDRYKNNNFPIYIEDQNVSFNRVYLLQKTVSVNIILESKAEISPFLPAKFPHCIAANTIILSLSPYYSETRRLLGSNYEFWSEVDDVEKIAYLIEKLYQLWKQSPDNLLLNRIDLENYLSVDYLKKVISDLNIEKLFL